MSAPMHAVLACCCARLALGAPEVRGGASAPYHWSGRAANAMASSWSPHVAPSNFTGGPLWVWPNELDEQVRHSPLIDHELSIYIMTSSRIRKFSPDGKLLWTWRLASAGDGKMAASCALYGGAVYALSAAYQPTGSGSWTGTVHVFSIDMATGAENWRRSHARFCWGDATSIFPYNGTLLLPVRDHMETRSYPFGVDGNNMILAVSALDGSYLWSFVADDVFWNFSPATPGDGTLLFASQCGGVYRITFGGELVWRSGRPPPGRQCGAGGGALGPNGVFYAEFNDWAHPQGPGALIAVRASDGAVLWERYFGQHGGGFQYPAVGPLEAGGPLAVVAAFGDLPGKPPIVHFPRWMPLAIQQYVYMVYLHVAAVQRLSFAVLGHPGFRSALVAMDADSGEVRWRYEEEAWYRWGPAGDEEGIIPRAVRQSPADPAGDVLCEPDPQGIPLIGGDGTVYGSSGHSGGLRAIRDRDGNGIIDPTEVSSFETGSAFLNSPSMAPNLLVAAPCWGPVYVFRSTGT